MGYERGQRAAFECLAQHLHSWLPESIMRGRHLCDMNKVGKVLKGLCAQYRREWLGGHDAFVRHQCKVMSSGDLRKIASTCKLGQIGSWAHARSSFWLVLNAYLLSTGTRRDEWSTKHAGDAFTKRGNFTWVDGKFESLSAAELDLRPRRNGDYLQGKNGPSG